ncbi:MAG: Thioredoxin family protein [Chitinophagaceae bacterium]|nr:Thioredoxin family protein [Chitinophagaceae bacterium]
MRRLSAILVLLSLAIIPCFSQFKMAPPISIKTMIGPAKDTTFYKNKFLVLDFWATWCAPCIASFPHLNDLQKKFRRYNVTFAAMTYEPETKVEKFFLKNSHIKLDVLKLIDQPDTTRKSRFGYTGKTFIDYNIRGIPQAVIINPLGELVWKGNSELTDSLLEQVLKGSYQPEVLSQAAQPANEKPTISHIDSIEINGIKIRSSILKNVIYGYAINFHNEIMTSFLGARIDDILKVLFNLSNQQVIKHKVMPVVALDMSRSFGITKDSLAIAAATALSKMYYFNYRLENRSYPVMEVTLENKDLLKKNGFTMEESFHGGTGTTNGYFFGINIKFTEIARILQGEYDRIVITNDTSFSLLKDQGLDIHIPAGKWEESIKYLAKEYGIRVRKTSRLLPTLILE